VLAAHDAGYFPRDLAVTPDGTLAVVRGGYTAPGTAGGSFVFDMATGARLASRPGEPAHYNGGAYLDSDAVVTTDRFAVVLSEETLAPGVYATRITVWDLHPSTSTLPLVAFETDTLSDLDGAPFDVALAPGGGFAAVRSEFEVGYVDLSTGTPSLAWVRPLFNMPGPFGLSAMDSIEVTDDRIATLSRWSNGGVGAQIDMFDPQGNQYYQLLFGDPHDLAITPSGTRLVARTSTQVLLYDITNLPTTGNQLSVLDFEQLASTHTNYGAGLDSIVATDTRAIAVARDNDAAEIRVYDLRADRLDVVLADRMDERPIDVDLSPDGATAWITGFTRVLGFDLRANTLVVDHDPTTGGGYPWCDGLAVGVNHVVAFGYTVNSGVGVPIPSNSGWVSILDTFRAPRAICTSTVNSAGTTAELYATGSARVASNDLELRVTGATPGAFGFFYYGDQSTAPVAYGDGFQCVGGQVGGFGVTTVRGDGLAQWDVDNTALPASGVPFAVGATATFQFVYRDSTVFGAGWNLSQGLEVTFTN